MRPEDRDTAHLWDMLRYARTAAELVDGGTFEAYQRNRTLQLALERALEIVGESARRLSEAFRSEHPEIPWRAIIGLRNLLAHDYGSILQERLWIVANDRVPELVRLIAPLVPEEPDSTE
jgi:uncharacterized protein with HEPN domain